MEAVNAKAAELAQTNLEEGQDFLAENAERDEVEVTESGLHEVFESGDGATPAQKTP